jgi:hypothetical protein
MSSETTEILRKRAEEHAAACAGLDDDPLIQAAFSPPAPIPPMESPMQAGGMLRRQAD